MLPLPMALRSCLVSCRDLAGTEHAVEVTAESLYEAVAQALGILRGDIWVEEIGEGLTELKVRVKQPAVEHRVRMKDFRRWLESQGKTPAECTRKRKLVALAKGKEGSDDPGWHLSLVQAARWPDVALGLSGLRPFRQKLLNWKRPTLVSRCPRPPWMFARCSLSRAARTGAAGAALPEVFAISYTEGVMSAELIDCRAVLQTLNFGQRIAEEERDYLARYFVETDQWRRMYSGEVDIVYGAKGYGKSALYYLLLDRSDSFDKLGITLITGESPRGTPVFRDLATEPPASEREFVDLWKLYILSLLGRVILQLGLTSPEARSLVDKLRGADLLETGGGLKALLKTVREYVRRFSGFESGVTFDPVSGLPSA